MAARAILAVRDGDRWHGVPVATNGAPAQTGTAILEEVELLSGRLQEVVDRLINRRPSGWRCLYSGRAQRDERPRAMGPESDLDDYRWMYTFDLRARTLLVERRVTRRWKELVHFGPDGMPDEPPTWFRPSVAGGLPRRDPTFSRKLGRRRLEAWCKSKQRDPEDAIDVVQAVLQKPFHEHRARRFWVPGDDDATSMMEVTVGPSTVIVPDRPRIGANVAFAEPESEMQPGVARDFCQLDYRVLAEWSDAGVARGWDIDDGPSLARHLAQQAACLALGNTQVHVVPGGDDELLETFVFRRVVKVVRNEAQEIDIRQVARFDDAVEEGDEVGIPVPDGGARFSVMLLRLFADTG